MHTAFRQMLRLMTARANRTQPMVTGHRRHAADEPAIRLNLSAARGQGVV